ncbi:hypothetical protein S7711_05443 [Stachybotrys chartarum IBT 7711]|uniref:Uncharacterized protein n=1 Tax=Stachybotrys chartarum (strain CBS 109288 / IBT 7711) TaxID=1280523 RepID=A0A084BAW2_STACB|nr:hypothetical protein S7711_05443 [Stachybotrys chartarum IBT 7711]
MEELVALFADITGSKSRDEHPPTPHHQGPDTKEPWDDGESRLARESGRSTRDPSRSTRRDASRSTRYTAREARESREFKDKRDRRDSRATKETRDSFVKDPKYAKDLEPGPPPYQEIADATVQPQVPIDDDAFTPTHPSGIIPTQACVKEYIDIPVDWVIHPSAPHFVICGRCYIDRIYLTQQWRREFVKYTPTTGTLLKCHFGAIPHMTTRWSKVHTAEDFLSFLKVMQRKKVAKPCPGDTYPRASVAWYTVAAVPGLRVCQECRRRLFGGTVYSKYLLPCDTTIFSICHGAFACTNRLVEQLLRDDNWDKFVDGVRTRIQLPSCPGQKASKEGTVGRWYKYTKPGSTNDSHICEACYLDYAYQTDKESNFSVNNRLATLPRCMASLREDQMPDTPDVEHGRAEIMRLLHGTDRRCYAQGTVGLKWHTTLNRPNGYGVCHGCYLSKIKPLGGEAYYTSKHDVGKRSSFACWMNSYHPFFRRHQQLLHEAFITGDISYLENSIKRFSRIPGCQQGGMGQGKNKRWWGWRCLRICGSCMKGGNLADTPAARNCGISFIMRILESF